MPKLLEGVINSLISCCNDNDISNEKLISNSKLVEKNHRGLRQKLLTIGGCAFGCKKEIFDKNLDDIKDDEKKYSSRKDDANVNSQWIANGETYYTWNELAYENEFEDFIAEFNQLYLDKYKISCINPNEKNKSFSLSEFTNDEKEKKEGAPKMTSKEPVMQKILFGAPGTGKSFKIDDPNKGYGLKNIPEFRKFRTTFHPDYDYAQFVGAYKPQKLQNNDNGLLSEEQLAQRLSKGFPTNNNEKEKTIATALFGLQYFKSLKDKTMAKIVELSGVGNSKYIGATLSAVVKARVRMPDKENEISYSFVPQVFAKAYATAWKLYLEGGSRDSKDIQVFLVIEEINRGNCAQIFGDIFQLLDRDENGFSQYSIDADYDFADWLKTNEEYGLKKDWELYVKFHYEKDGKTINPVSDTKIALPPNLNILATMNTSDQSLFPMDSAFKRRFDWEYVPISFTDENGNEKEASKFEIEILDKDKKPCKREGDEPYLWKDFVEKINTKILNITKSEDKQLGEFFIKPDKEKDGKLLIISMERFLGKVMFYLWNDVCKDEHENDSFFTIQEEKDKKYFTFQDLFRDGTLLKRFMEELFKDKPTE